MADQYRVNGNIFSWGSIVLKAGNERFTGFNAISYADKRERVKVYGMGRHQAPRGRTRGKYSVDPVKLSGPKDSTRDFRRFLAQQAADGISIGDVVFQIVVQFVEPGEATQTVVIDRCVLTGDSSSHEEGSDPLKDEFEFDAMLITRNKYTLFDSSKGAP